MKLADYLSGNEVSTAEFAAQINATQATVSRYVTGKRIPDPTIMKRIFVATDGQVSPNDFYALPTAASEPAGAQR